MELLKKWTEQYMHIHCCYDGGKNYKWTQAGNELDSLAEQIDVGLHSLDKIWKRELAWILYREVNAESKRVWEIARRNKEYQN